jgi:hypothetical protein
MVAHGLGEKKTLAKELIKVVVSAKPYMNAIKRKALIIVTNAPNSLVANSRSLQIHGKNMARI